MIETVIIAFIFAKVKGTEIKEIFRHWEFYPVFIGALTYIFLQIGMFKGDYSFLYIDLKYISRASSEWA